MPYYTYICENCEGADEALFPLSAWREDQTIECPVCHHEAWRVLEVGQGVQLGGGASTGRHFPYFDKSLNCYVDTAADRRRICKERDLIPLDGADISDIPVNAQWAEEDRLLKVYDDYKDKLDNAPEFAEHRQLRDMGHPAHQTVE